MDMRPALSAWLCPVTASAEQIHALAAANRLTPDHLTGLADLQAMCAHDLRPRPLATLAYLEQAHQDLMAQIRRLGEHDPARVVHIRSEDGYDYAMTPRKALRRELDHVLDHHHQVDQWLDWQAGAEAPTPADGWAPSDPMLPDDTLAISEGDLDAWVWRLDMSWRLLLHRVAQLSDAQLDWKPSDGGWPLRQVLYHLGRGFYAAWIDQPLPDEPLARYEEATRRFQARLRQHLDRPLADGLGFVSRDGELFTPHTCVLAVLAAEHDAHARATSPESSRATRPCS